MKGDERMCCDSCKALRAAVEKFLEPWEPDHYPQLRAALAAARGDAGDELKSARDHLDIARKILRAPEED